MTKARFDKRGWSVWAATLISVVPAFAVAADAPDVDFLELTAPDGVDSAVELVEPLSQTNIDDDRVWEDISYGTGEADFTAIAIDPQNPKRLFAGANGAVYSSEDGGLSWLRVLRIRGTGNSALSSSQRDRGALQSDVDDRNDDAREEAIEEIKREIADELIAELGDLGEQLAEEIAEELAEERLDEEGDRIAEDAAADRRRREPQADDDTQSPDEYKQLQPRRVHRVVILPSGVVLAATGSGLYRSKDRGETFDPLEFGLVPSEKDVRAVAVHPLDPNVIYAGTLAGLYFTRDGGESWAEASGFPGKFNIFDVVVDPGNPARILAATEQGIWRSTDSGTTFVGVHQPTSPLAQFTRSIAFDPTDPRIVFGGTQEGLFRSLDGGIEWERVESPGLNARDVQDFGSAEWGLVAATSNGVFLSADAGASFRELYAGLDARDVRRVATAAGPLDTYAATGRGLFVYRAPEARARKVAALQAIQDLVKREPPVSDVMTKALKFSYVDFDPSDWRDRAAWAAALPKVILRWGGTNPWSLPGVAVRGGFTAADVIPSEVYRWPSRDAWQVTATWDATRLIYSESLVNSSSAFRILQRQRSRVLRRIVNTYSARRRLQVALLQSPPVDLRSFALKSLQVDELTSVLDGLTDGGFSSSIAEPAPSPSPETRPGGPPAPTGRRKK